MTPLQLSTDRCLLIDGDTDGNLDFGFTPSGAENLAELFYAWQFNNNFQLTPSVQWVE